jgi:hypothetical protein
MVLFSVVVSPVYHIIVSRQVKNPEKIKKILASYLLDLAGYTIITQTRYFRWYNPPVAG